MPTMGSGDPWGTSPYGKCFEVDKSLCMCCEAPYSTWADYQPHPLVHFFSTCLPCVYLMLLPATDPRGIDPLLEEARSRAPWPVCYSPAAHLCVCGHHGPDAGHTARSGSIPAPPQEAAGSKDG